VFDKLGVDGLMDAVQAAGGDTLADGAFGWPSVRN
jgi:hypothetical protein